MQRSILLAALLLAGCEGTRVIPNNTLPLSHTYQPPVEGVVAAAAIGVAAYYVLDPLAPNWEVRTARLDTTRVEIKLRRKRFATGGDGESVALFRRHAERIAGDNGAPGYSVLSFEEGIDSETTVARRVSRGVIRLWPPAAASEQSPAPLLPARPGPQSG